MNTQQEQDRMILSSAPTDQPLNDIELAALERERDREATATPAQASGNCPTSHSPLLWSFDGYRIMAGPFDVGSSMDWTGTYVQVATLTLNTEHTPKPIMEENAAFIVRACNNAQRLADALKSVTFDIRNRKGSGNPITYGTLRKVSEALAQWGKDNE